MTRPSFLKARAALDTDLYCITSAAHSRGRSNIEVVETLLAEGVRLLQYREKTLSMLQKYEDCLRIRQLTRDAGAVFIVNDHVDLALAVKADGVHIGQDDLPVDAVRRLAGNEMIIGVSTHAPEQARTAIDQGADYIGVGPLYRTYTKTDVCDPVGLTYLDHVSTTLSVPFVAIGGIKAHNVAEVIGHGARCVCMVTEIVGADDIGAKIKEIRLNMKNSI